MKTIKIPKGEHSKHAPSAAERVRYCPASLKREEQFLNVSNRRALEGTALHYIAELVVSNGKPISHYKEHIIVTGDKKIIKITDELLDRIKYYVEYVKENKKVIVACEKLVQSDLLIKGQFGKSDLIIFRNSTLEIHDLKTGYVQVTPKNCTQLLIYAVMALDMELVDFDSVKKVRLVIHQYPASSPKSSTYSMDEIKAFVKEMKAAYKKAYAKNPKAIPGTHCEYCRASLTCAERNKTILESANAELVAGISAKMTLEDCDKLLQKERPLLKLLDYAKQQVKEAIKSGVKFNTNFELEDGRKKPREWTEDAAVILKVLKQKFNLSGDDMVKIEIKSPAEVEKVIGAEGMAKLELLGLVKRPRPDKVLKQKTSRSMTLEFDEYPLLTKEGEKR